LIQLTWNYYEFFYYYDFDVSSDMAIPIQEDRVVQSLLGLFLALRHMVPYLVTEDHSDESLKGSFGVMMKEQEVKVNLEQLIQVHVCLFSKIILHCLAGNTGQGIHECDRYGFNQMVKDTKLP
jgi:hypothetical protein